ncbi:cytosine permease [Salinibacterium sp. PAMC 21357]|uniref:cytosine permease n=1 Tax=Salinibacterium sp. PAMC 21357 TaxID=1112215 RepID=UPI00028A1841|nr:cytosine permease [Salinibacterium sp. PAMC 21357]
MAFHDDVDDANDANEKTSSEQDFELRFPRRAASSFPVNSSADDDEKTKPVDSSEASSDGVFDLDAAFTASSDSPSDEPTNVPAPPPSASSFAPIDLNEEFQRSDLSDALDQGMPPWAMAPAPDPTQAVSQLDAPDGLSSDQDAPEVPAPDAPEPKDAAPEDDDPYRIPADYTTPDFFASRISRRRPPVSNDEDETDVALNLSPASESAVDGDGSGNQADNVAESAEPEASKDFDFDALFATQNPTANSVQAETVNDTSWADVSPAVDPFDSVSSDHAPETNNVWKLGPLEPNVSPATAASEPATVEPELEEPELEEPELEEPELEELVVAEPNTITADATAADEAPVDSEPTALGETDLQDEPAAAYENDVSDDNEASPDAVLAPDENASTAEINSSDEAVSIGDAIGSADTTESHDVATPPEASEADDVAAAGLPLPVAEVIEGAPMWNLDGVGAPDPLQNTQPSLDVERSSSLEFPADVFATAAAEFAPKQTDDQPYDAQTSDNEPSSLDNDPSFPVKEASEPVGAEDSNFGELLGFAPDVADAGLDLDAHDHGNESENATAAEAPPEVLDSSHVPEATVVSASAEAPEPSESAESFAPADFVVPSGEADSAHDALALDSADEPSGSEIPAAVDAEEAEDSADAATDGSVNGPSVEKWTPFAQHDSSNTEDVLEPAEDPEVFAAPTEPALSEEATAVEEATPSEEGTAPEEATASEEGIAPEVATPSEEAVALAEIFAPSEFAGPVESFAPAEPIAPAEPVAPAEAAVPTEKVEPVDVLNSDEVDANANAETSPAAAAEAPTPEEWNPFAAFASTDTADSLDSRESAEEPISQAEVPDSDAPEEWNPFHAFEPVDSSAVIDETPDAEEPESTDVPVIEEASTLADEESISQPPFEAPDQTLVAPSADVADAVVQSNLLAPPAAGEFAGETKAFNGEDAVSAAATEIPTTEPDVSAAETEIPTPPVRRSMADDELLTWADSPENQSTGTLSVIEVLEAQLRLREEDAREYREWETTLRSQGRADAGDADDATSPSVADPAPRSDVSTDAAGPAVVENSASPAAAPVTPAVQLPAWEVPPPSDSWSPGADFDDEIPFAAHADPTGSITLPFQDADSPSGPTTESMQAPESVSPRASESDNVSFGQSRFAPSADDSAHASVPDVAQFAAPTPEPAPEEVDDSKSESESESAPVIAPGVGLLADVAPTGQVTTEEDADSDSAIEAEAEAPSEAEAETASAIETGPEQVVPHFDAESGLLSLGGIASPQEPTAPPIDDNFSAPEASRFAPSPQLPLDEDGDYDEIPFAPPALVEPVTAPSTPRSNLDEHVSFGDFGFTPPISGEPEASASAAAPIAEPEAEPPFAFGLDVPSESASAATSEPLATDTEAFSDNAADTTAVDSDTAVEDLETEAASATFSFASQETPRYVPSAPVSFDDLLKTDDVDVIDDEPEDDDVNPLDLFIAEPESPVQQGDPLSDVQTGSVTITDAMQEAETDEAVDASDRSTDSSDLAAPDTSLDSNPIPFAAGAAAGIAGSAAAAHIAAPSVASPSAPVSNAPSVAAPQATDSAAVPQPMLLSNARVSQQPLGLGDVAPTAQPVFSLEESGLEPTPMDRRVGQAARMFWLWFAANSSIVSLGLGAAVFAVGMSLRQSIVAILAGVALSFIPLGLTTLAGKRSGQPTMVISRSAFGVVGNVVPSVIALVARLFWGAVLLWVLASSVTIVLIGSDLNVGLGDRQLLLIALALSFLVALVIAFAGYPLFARIQLILSIISGVLVVGLIAFTAQYIDVAQALTTPDGSWLLTLTGAVLVFSFLGLVWAYSGADIARYQRTSSSGAASALSASFGATLPAFVLIAYGALLAASDPAIARDFLGSPLDTLLTLLPGWYPIPLLLAAALSLLSGITLSLYSGGFALQAVGVRLPRQWSIVIVGVLLGALAILFAFGIDGGINELFRDVATTLAVPTAAWVGIFAAETMIRNRRLDSASLTSRGGIYADVRWVNLSAFLAISAIGFALTSATIGWLSWQGYGFVALGVDLNSELAATDLGVLVALVLGILTPLVAGIPAIRHQEAGSSERATRHA